MLSLCIGKRQKGGSIQSRDPPSHSEEWDHPNMPAAPRFPLSDHCDGRRFFNPRNHINRHWFQVLQWKLNARPAVWPKWIDVNPQTPPPAPKDGTLSATWINHASFLLQTRLGSVLIDPVYSERASPFAWSGPRRVHAPGVTFDNLPTIDAILISHDHYDHCDLQTLRLLSQRYPHARLITPLGNGALARTAGFKSSLITELDWWDAHELAEGFHIRLTPSRHWSNRVRGLRNRRLWGGFFIHSGGRTAHFVGDTGYEAGLFGEIRQRCGGPDLAMIPIGAYEPRWFMEPQHCNPAEAVQIHRDLGSRQSVAMHWGTFQLTDERRDAPVEALEAALRAAGIPPGAFRALNPGESLTV